VAKDRVRKDISVGDIEISDITQRTVVLIGGKGSGKSTAIRQLAREANSVKLPVILFDPTGALKVDEFNVVSVQQGFTEEELDALRRIIRAIWKRKQILVIDVSDLTREENSLLANDVFGDLFKRHTGVVMIDEIPEFVPQFGAFKSEELIRFVRKCRNKNIGVVMATQRPASVSKEVLALGDLYMIFRVQHPPDRETVSKLFSLHYESKSEVNGVVNKITTFSPGMCRVVDFSS